MAEEDAPTTATAPPRQPPTADEQSVAKANEAIAIRPKRGRLTLLSRRIYNALLYHSQRQGVDEPVYKLALSELIGDARFNSNNTELLKAHLRDMQATTIEWSTSGPALKRWVSSQLLGTVTIEEQGRGRACMVTWRYPEEIKERLVRPHQYTRVLLEISGQMRSYSAAVLYEIGARYLTSPGRLSMREDVVWWAAVLTGRSDIKEVDYRFLKRDVISKALAEIDALCEDFSIELIEHKRGRKIEEIQFRVVPKMQPRLGDIPNAERNVFDLALVGRLIALGIKQEEAQDLYATTDEAQLRATLDHVDQRLRSPTMPELKSPAAYFKDALKKGYAAIKSLPPADAAPPRRPTGRPPRRPPCRCRCPTACSASASSGKTTAWRRRARCSPRCSRPRRATCAASSKPSASSSWRRPLRAPGAATARPAGLPRARSTNGLRRPPGPRSRRTACCWTSRCSAAWPASEASGDRSTGRWSRI
jgi:hypothetical protein